MALSCMPYLVSNMGSEMVYILDQRLRAQAVPPDKATKVINDIAAALFSEDFVTALSVPQPAYSERSLRQIFDRLAHSSIMRLSETSMDKLFDLMVMGFKLQLAHMLRPSDILDVTREHVHYVKKLVDNADIIACIEHFESRWIGQPDAEDKDDATAHAEAPGNSDLGDVRSMRAADWFHLRHCLLNVFHEKKIKVSLFMNEGLQHASGSFVLPKRNDISGFGEKKRRVGTLWRWEAGSTTKFEDEHLYIPGSASPGTYTHHPISRGANFYSEEVKAASARAPDVSTSAASSATDLKEPTSIPTTRVTTSSDGGTSGIESLTSPKSSVGSRSLLFEEASGSQAAYEAQQQQQQQQRRKSVDIPEPEHCVGATQSLNSLAALIVTSSAASNSGNKNNFKINLFPDELQVAGQGNEHAAGETSGAENDSVASKRDRSGSISIDASDKISTSHSRNLQSLMDDLHDEKKSHESSRDDLLELMDGLVTE